MLDVLLMAILQLALLAGTSLRACAMDPSSDKWAHHSEPNVARICCSCVKWCSKRFASVLPCRMSLGDASLGSRMRTTGVALLASHNAHSNGARVRALEHVAAPLQGR